MSMPALAKVGENRLAVAAIRCQRLADLAVIGEGLQGALGHGVDREGRRERLHIEGVGGFRVLGAGAGPQQALGTGAAVGSALKARRGEQVEIGLVGALADGDAEPVGELCRNLAGDRDVPAADEERGHRGDGRVQPSRDPPLDAAQVRFGRRDVLLAGEQQCDVDRHAGKDRLLDGRQSFRGTGNLDEEIGLAGTLVEVDRGRQGALRIVRQERRHFERHPAVHAIGPGKDRLEQVGGTGQIRKRQREEQVLGRLGRRRRPRHVLVIHGAVLDRIVEDRRVRGQPRHREIVDVAFQRAAVQQLAGDVVEPQALADVVQLLG